MKEVTLSRAEVNRRIQTLTVDPWKHLSGYINGCSVNAWATGHRRRIARISVCAISKQGGNLAKAIALAKELHRLTGLVVHYHGGLTGGQILNNGSRLNFPVTATPRQALP
jgi:hypothetical protein